MSQEADTREEQPIGPEEQDAAGVMGEGGVISHPARDPIPEQKKEPLIQAVAVLLDNMQHAFAHTLESEIPPAVALALALFALAEGEENLDALMPDEPIPEPQLKYIQNNYHSSRAHRILHQLTFYPDFTCEIGVQLLDGDFHLKHPLQPSTSTHPPVAAAHGLLEHSTALPPKALVQAVVYFFDTLRIELKEEKAEEVKMRYRDLILLLEALAESEPHFVSLVLRLKSDPDTSSFADHIETYVQNNPLFHTLWEYPHFVHKIRIYLVDNDLEGLHAYLSILLQEERPRIRATADRFSPRESKEGEREENLKEEQELLHFVLGLYECIVASAGPAGLDLKSPPRFTPSFFTSRCINALLLRKEHPQIFDKLCGDPFLSQEVGTAIAIYALENPRLSALLTSQSNLRRWIMSELKNDNVAVLYARAGRVPPPFLAASRSRVEISEEEAYLTPPHRPHRPFPPAAGSPIISLPFPLHLSLLPPLVLPPNQLPPSGRRPPSPVELLPMHGFTSQVAKQARQEAQRNLAQLIVGLYEAMGKQCPKVPEKKRAIFTAQIVRVLLYANREEKLISLCFRDDTLQLGTIAWQHLEQHPELGILARDYPPFILSICTQLEQGEVAAFMRRFSENPVTVEESAARGAIFGSS